ncbi:hypothetical protein ABZP36_004929 [Zizania latifolia]
MSVAKKEEQVCSHRLGPRLGEPAVGVPIKKRPVCLSDRLVPPPSMRPSSPAMGVTVSDAEAGCSKDTFLNRYVSQDTNAIAKGNGMFNPLGQNYAKRSLIQALTERKGLLVDGSSEIPSIRESNAGSVASVDETQSHKFLTLGLQLPSHQNGKINSSSVVKEEEIDQGFSSFSSADSHKDIRATSELKSSFDSSFGQLPNLDLNVPLDPLDPVESLPAMHDCGSRLYPESVQHQKERDPLVAPVSTVSSGLRQNIDISLNLSSAYGLSNKRVATDVTLDLQLKPPVRPELGINWKELAPVPELRLSLSAKHVDDSENSAPNAAVRSEPAGRDKKITREIGMPRTNKSPVEKVVRLVPCNGNTHKTMPSAVAGIEKMTSGCLVKKEPVEQSQQHIPNDVEKMQLLESQSVGLPNNCAEMEKTVSTCQVPEKAALDLNSETIPNVATANVPLPNERLCDSIHIETMCADPEVKKSIKCEETTAVIPTPAFASTSGQCSPLVATKPLPLKGCNANPTVGLCASASQPSLPTEPACCNPDEASVDCKPTTSHVHSRDAVEACDPLQSSSNPSESLVPSSQNCAVVDGMSQGSAEMDCSEDDNIVSQLPTTNKPHGGRVGNNEISDDGMDANNMGINVQTGHGTDTHPDCSLVTNKVGMQGVRDDKRIDVKDGISSHSFQDGHQSGDLFNKESRNKQLLRSDKNSPVNNSDNIMSVETSTGSSSADLRRLSSLGTSASPKMESTVESHKDSDSSCLEKGKSPKIKSKGRQSPLGKETANSSEDHEKNAVKSEHQTGSEEVARASELHPRDPVLCEASHLDGASSSQPHNECGMVKSASERSECEKSNPDTSRTISVQNERDEQVDGPQWRELGYAHVNRNERWERFMQSERGKNKGEYRGGRHSSDTINQRRLDHHYGGRGVGPCAHPRNFYGPRMDEPEIYFAEEPMNGRRWPFEDDIGHLHRIPHRRHHSPSMNNQLHGSLMRDMDFDSFTGRDIPDHRLLVHGHTEDLSDDMIEDRFYVPHSHHQHIQGDRAFVHRDRSHSPGQRRGAPVHLHRRRSPEAMRRSPPLIRTGRPYLPQRHHTGHHGSPFDRIGHDDRGMQRKMRRCGMNEDVAGDTFEPPLHPAELAELHAEAELSERRRKFGDRRTYLRSLEERPVGDHDEMLPYGADGDMDMDIGDGGGGLREPDGRFRSRLGHRGIGEQEDYYRCHGPRGWRDGSSNGSRQKRPRY